VAVSAPPEKSHLQGTDDAGIAQISIAILASVGYIE